MKPGADDTLCSAWFGARAGNAWVATLRDKPWIHLSAKAVWLICSVLSCMSVFDVAAVRGWVNPSRYNQLRAPLMEQLAPSAEAEPAAPAAETAGGGSAPFAAAADGGEAPALVAAPPSSPQSASATGGPEAVVLVGAPAE